MPEEFTVMYDLWWAGNCVCRMCEHRWVAVLAVGSCIDDVLTRLECPNCHNTTGEESFDD